MKAGFARVSITPPIGTRMLGFGGRDRAKGCEGIHDDVFARALFLQHGDECAMIVAYDLCFFGRAEADRIRGALGRALNLAPRQILLNFSHTHVGPCTATWGFSGFDAPDILYMNAVEQATVQAAQTARAGARKATIQAGRTETRLPVSRRKPNGKGGVEWRPYPEGTVCRSLPLCLLKDADGRVISLLYSVACHPSTTGGWQISADYPGVACRILDRQLGLRDGGSLFLQGCGGDAKACTIANGRDDVDVAWRTGSWDDVEQAGRIVADEVRRALDAGLRPVSPALAAAETQTVWPLLPTPARALLVSIAENPGAYELQRMWARRQIEILDRGGKLPTAADITLHGIRLGRGLRIAALEGEAVGELGLFVEAFYGSGTTFALGYTDGTQLYLPSERMLPEGGYEVESYYEYGFPSPLAPGLQRILKKSLTDLRHRGID